MTSTQNRFRKRAKSGKTKPSSFSPRYNPFYAHDHTTIVLKYTSHLGRGVQVTLMSEERERSAAQIQELQEQIMELKQAAGLQQRCSQ